MNTEKVDLLCMGCFIQLAENNGVCPHCGYNETAQVVSPHQLHPRIILNGKYLLGRVLGEGGFGITYIGWDLNLDIKVAIKEYYPNGIVTRDGTTTVFPYSGDKTEIFTFGRDRFVQEAKNLAKFYALPGIVSVKDYFQENDTAYIVMEFVEGETLKVKLAGAGGMLPVSEVLEYMKPVIKSLYEVHSAGIIHRDISPDNMIITREGNSKLIDFGAARGVSDGQQSLSVLLKPGFAPEEQYRTRGVQGAWSDIYALCATIYRAITGVTPDEALERISEDMLKPPRQLGVSMTVELEAAIMKGLAVKQNDRFQTVMDLYAALYGPQTGIPATMPVSVSHQSSTTAPDITVPHEKTGPESAPASAANPFVTWITQNKIKAAAIGGICIVTLAAFAIRGLILLNTDKSDPPVYMAADANLQQSGKSLRDNTVPIFGEGRDEPQDDTVPTSVEDGDEQDDITSSSAEDENEQDNAVPMSANDTDRTSDGLTESSAASTPESNVPASTEATTEQPTPASTPAPTPTVTDVTGQSYTLTTSIYTANVTYTGKWKDDRPNGDGVATFSEAVPGRFNVGDTLSGNWVNGLIEGYGVYTSGSYQLKGNFVKGLKEGTVKQYDNGEHIGDIEFKNGSPAP